MWVCKVATAVAKGDPRSKFSCVPILPDFLKFSLFSWQYLAWGGVGDFVGFIALLKDFVWMILFMVAGASLVKFCTSDPGKFLAVWLVQRRGFNLEA